MIEACKYWNMAQRQGEITTEIVVWKETRELGIEESRSLVKEER